MSDKIPKSKLIDAWLLEKGYVAQYKGGGNYRTVGKGEERAEALNSLLQTFIQNGYDEEEIRFNDTIRMILEELTCSDRRTGPKHKKQLEKWQADIEEEWEFQLREEFGKKHTDKVADAKDRPKAAPRPQANPDEEVPAFMPPESKLDPKKFQGFTSAPIEEDEEFKKVLEELKNG